TSPIPLEILLATGREPVDLMRLFLQDSEPRHLLEEAHLAGMTPDAPLIDRALYGTVLARGIREVIVAAVADRPTRDLADLLARHDVRVTWFGWPADRSRESLALEIKKLARHFGAVPVDIDRSLRHLGRVRERLRELDRLVWQEERLEPSQVWHVQLAAADMRAEPERYLDEIEQLIGTSRQAPTAKKATRIACLGDLPCWSDFFLTLEEFGGRAIFTEHVHHLTMPARADSLVDQYLAFDLPYDLHRRLDSCLTAIRERGADALVLVRTGRTPGETTFELLVRQMVELPLLVVNCNDCGPLDLSTRLRVRDFLQLLQSGTR
ncbi:MAG: 2-hydroxyacyl-CoA dehydratase, partial [Deltaproteobacteria bacterium]